MRNLSLPNSEAAAVQSRAGPAGPSAASREAAPLTGGCGAKLRRFAGVIGRGGSGACQTGHLLGMRLLGGLGEDQRDRFD